MKQILGYSLIAIGFIGFLFFWKYKGNVIPLKELWFIISLLTIIIGAYFSAKYIFQKAKMEFSNNPRTVQIDHLKQFGDQVSVTLDNAEIKTRSYQQEDNNDGYPSRREIFDSLYDDNRNYKTVEIQQTYIVFYKQYKDKTYKFISQPTSQNEIAVKMYIEKHRGINLFIDPKNPANYYFDLPLCLMRTAGNIGFAESLVAN